MTLLTRKLDGENPPWSEDRKNYDQVGPLHENLRKSMSKTMTKVRPNYDQEGQKIENLDFKGSYLLNKAKLLENYKAYLYIFTQFLAPPIIVLLQCSLLTQQFLHLYLPPNC